MVPHPFPGHYVGHDVLDPAVEGIRDPLQAFGLLAVPLDSRHA